MRNTCAKFTRYCELINIRMIGDGMFLNRDRNAYIYIYLYPNKNDKAPPPQYVTHSICLPTNLIISNAGSFIAVMHINLELINRMLQLNILKSWKSLLFLMDARPFQLLMQKGAKKSIHLYQSYVGTCIRLRFRLKSQHSCSWNTQLQRQQPISVNFTVDFYVSFSHRDRILLLGG